MTEQILAVQTAMKRYDPSVIGYCWDDLSPRIQLEPRGEKGCIEMRAVHKERGTQLVAEEHLMKFNGINATVQSVVQFAVQREWQSPQSSLLNGWKKTNPTMKLGTHRQEAALQQPAQRLSHQHNGGTYDVAKLDDVHHILPPYPIVKVRNACLAKRSLLHKD